MCYIVGTERHLQTSELMEKEASRMVMVGRGGAEVYYSDLGVGGGAVQALPQRVKFASTSTFCPTTSPSTTTHPPPPHQPATMRPINKKVAHKEEVELEEEEEYEEEEEEYEEEDFEEEESDEEEELVNEEPPKDVDCYKVLGVEKTATADEVKKAYRKAALVHHPGKYIFYS